MLPMEQPAGLISVLLDPGATLAERDDAAMDLSQFDQPETIAALLQVGCDVGESEVVLASAGESLAEILLRNGRTWPGEVDRLAPVARREFDATVSRSTD